MSYISYLPKKGGFNTLEEYLHRPGDRGLTGRNPLDYKMGGYVVRKEQKTGKRYIAYQENKEKLKAYEGTAKFDELMAKSASRKSSKIVHIEHIKHKAHHGLKTPEEYIREQRIENTRNRELRMKSFPIKLKPRVVVHPTIFTPAENVMTPVEYIHATKPLTREEHIRGKRSTEDEDRKIHEDAHDRAEYDNRPISVEEYRKLFPVKPQVIPNPPPLPPPLHRPPQPIRRILSKLRDIEDYIKDLYIEDDRIEPHYGHHLIEDFEDNLSEGEIPSNRRPQRKSRIPRGHKKHSTL